MSVISITPDPDAQPVVQELEEVTPEAPVPTEPDFTQRPHAFSENYQGGEFVYFQARLAQVLEVGAYGIPIKVRQLAIIPREDIFLHHDLLASLDRIEWMEWDVPLATNCLGRISAPSTYCFHPTVPVILYSQLVQEIMHTLRSVAVELAIRQPQRPLLLPVIEERLIHLWGRVCDTDDQVTEEGIATLTSFYEEIMTGVQRLVKNSLPVIAQGVEVCDYRLVK